MENRILYLDYTKSFAIFLVVVGHVISKLWGDELGCNNIIYHIIYSFHMPLFMYVSGFCAYRNNSVYTTSVLLKNIWKKLKYLLWPYILWSFIMSFIDDEDFINGVLLQVHGGVWFLLCLFEIFVIFYIVDFLLGKAKLGNDYVTVFVFAITTCILQFVCNKTALSRISLYLNLDMLGIHFKYFILGYLFARYDILRKLLLNSYGFIVALLSFISLLYIEYGKYNYMNFITITLTAFTGVLFIVNLFIKIDIKGKLKMVISYVGKKTLPIYLIHMMLFTGVSPFIRNFININDTILDVLFVSLTIALFTILFCLIVDCFIARNKYLSLLLYGRQTN